MNANLSLSEREWQLVAQLLEQERNELRPEIHHTDSPTVHDDLKDRLVLVDALIEKLRGQAAS